MWDLQNLLHFGSWTFQGKAGHAHPKVNLGSGAALLPSRRSPPAFGGLEGAGGPAATSFLGVRTCQPHQNNLCFTRFLGQGQNRSEPSPAELPRRCVHPGQPEHVPRYEPQSGTLLQLNELGELSVSGAACAPLEFTKVYWYLHLDLSVLTWLWAFWLEGLASPEQQAVQLCKTEGTEKQGVSTPFLRFVSSQPASVCLAAQRAACPPCESGRIGSVAQSPVTFPDILQALGVKRRARASQKDPTLKCPWRYFCWLIVPLKIIFKKVSRK